MFPISYNKPRESLHYLEKEYVTSVDVCEEITAMTTLLSLAICLVAAPGLVTFPGKYYVSSAYQLVI